MAFSFDTRWLIFPILLGAACSTTSQCGPNTCAGCCGFDGTCQVSSSAACGVFGNACTTCLGRRQLDSPMERQRLESHAKRRLDCPRVGTRAQRCLARDRQGRPVVGRLGVGDFGASRAVSRRRRRGQQRLGGRRFRENLQGPLNARMPAVRNSKLAIQAPPREDTTPKCRTTEASNAHPNPWLAERGIISHTDAGSPVTKSAPNHHHSRSATNTD